MVKNKNNIGVYCISNGFEHDHSITLLSGGQILKHISLERITRVKYDNTLLKRQNVIFNPNFISELEYNNSNLVFADSFTDFNIEFRNLSIKAEIASSEFPYTRKILNSSNMGNKTVRIIPHEICHIFSAIPFYNNIDNKTLCIHIDGGASYSSRSIWLLENSELIYLESDWESHDDVNNFSNNKLTQIILGVYGRYNADLIAPGRLMGLSAYGSFRDDIYDWLKKNNWFYNTTAQEFLNRCKLDYSIKPDLNNPLDDFLTDIARTIQYNFTQEALKYVKYAKNKTKAKSLIYSGGAALNIITNSKIDEDLGFKRIMIPPCCNDTGISIGAGIYQSFGQEKIRKHTPFLCNSDLDGFLGPNEKDLKKIAFSLSNNEIIGIAIGKGEVGPRALGHRSILASPHDKKMKFIVSTLIKNRETYRPLAPIILEDLAKKIFYRIPKSDSIEFMLHEFEVKPNYLDDIPAVIHVDNTARAQIVKENNIDEELDDLDFIRKLLRFLWENYDIPCLINTSFNASGEPIDHNSEQALRSAKTMALNKLILGNKVIKISNKNWLKSTN